MILCRNNSHRQEYNPIACLLGTGIISGIVGTALMSFAQVIEMKFSGRKPSDTPARAGEKVLGVKPHSEESKQRFNNLVHWSYGSLWGLFRVDLFLIGLMGLPALIIHFLSIWIGGMTLLPRLHVSTPPWKWGWKAVFTDGFFHLVYASGAGIVFDRLIEKR
ncbi:MAG: hypothetical protein ACOC4C_04890 [Fibrobacterota bacterium]